MNPRATYRFGFAACVDGLDYYIEAATDSSYADLRSGAVSWWAERLWVEAAQSVEIPVNGFDDRHADELEERALAAAYEAALASREEAA